MKRIEKDYLMNLKVEIKKGKELFYPSTPHVQAKAKSNNIDFSYY